MNKLQQTDSNHFINFVVTRIKRNQNLLGVMTGGTGSGKTYSAITLCEALSNILGTSFTIKDVVFSPQEFMSRINSGELKKGSCLVFDEAGVGYSAREWWSISNKLINYLMQTFRHRNYIVIFTTPDLAFIDKACRKLVHVHFETQTIDYFKRLVVVKPFIGQPNQRSGKIYWKYLRVPVEGSVVPQKVERVCFGLPSKSLIDEYEAKKTDYTNKLNEEIEKGLKGKGKVKPITDIEKRYLTYHKMSLTAREVADKEKVSVTRVYQYWNILRRKGHIMPDP